MRIVAPYELTRTLRLKPSDSGQNLVDFLCMRFPFIPKETWEKRINNGWLRMNSKPLNSHFVINGRGLISHYSPYVAEPSVPDSVKVIEETRDWLAVYKPAPMPMHQGGRYYKNTLLYILSEMGYSGVKPVHRLDSVTSGLVLLAKNKQTALELTRLFAGNKVRKTYQAIVNGEFPEEPFEVDVPIRRKNGFVFECGHHLAGAKKAVTRFILEERGEGISRVKCFPLTGRTHQIRLHLCHAGFPVADDPIYGMDGDQSGRKLQNSAIMLQSSGIQIDEMGINLSF
ncbi:MAG: pseudouridine synthase [Balneolaceae bacterium]